MVGKSLFSLVAAPVVVVSDFQIVSYSEMSHVSFRLPCILWYRVYHTGHSGYHIAQYIAMSSSIAVYHKLLFVQKYYNSIESSQLKAHKNQRLGSISPCLLEQTFLKLKVFAFTSTVLISGPFDCRCTARVFNQMFNNNRIKTLHCDNFALLHPLDFRSPIVSIADITCT